MAEGAGERQKASAKGHAIEDDSLVVTETTGKMHFASLHHHTTYSWLDGFGQPYQHAEPAARSGYKSLAVTEHGNISSHPAHQKACKERGIKPLFGCELYTAPVGVTEPTKKNPLGMSRAKNHLTILAEDDAGYRAMCRLVSKGWAEGFFQYPTVTGDMFKKDHEGLIVLSGCTASLLATSLIGGKNIDKSKASYERAKKVAAQFRDMLGDRYYLEVQQMPELDDVCEINQNYERLSKELGIPLVATADVHVPTEDDMEMRPILHAIGRGGRSVEEMGQEWDYTVPGYIPPSDKFVYKRLIATGLSKEAAKQAILSTEEIGERCSAELPTMPMVRFPTNGISAKELCWKWLREGWAYRGLNRLTKREKNRYVKQLKHEMKLIESKDYIDYFLIVADLTKFAKDNGIPVGPGRGSAAGSLVCYLLRITEVNPMIYPNLTFERFIDITRADLPDIDLDFDDERRVEVFEYAQRKYGYEQTGKIGTITKYKSKNSMDDIARLYKIPKWEIDKVKDLMIERSGGDMRASDTVEDTIAAFEQAREVFDNFPDLYKVMKLEGQIKGLGIHAAGLVIASQPITDVCATYRREHSSGYVEEVTSLDKYSGEELGLLKIDILGLKEMRILRMCCEAVGMSVDDLYNISLKDPKTRRGFKNSDVTGIFQFDGWSTQLVCDQVRPSNFIEACDVIAISRPGPLHNGASSEYIDVKRRGKEPHRFHKKLDEILEPTAYQIVYQEQILKICMQVGEFDHTSVSQIRRIISRRLGEQEFNRQAEKFIKGAMENGVDEKAAKEIWGAMITAGAYAFNFAHTVSYGMVAWWSMWFKQNHPKVFYTSSLAARNKDKEKVQYLLRDAVEHGIKVLPPHPNKSSATWTVEDEGIRAGFEQVPGIGEKGAIAIIETRKELGKFKSWDELIKVKGIGPKSLEKIVEFCTAEDPFQITYLQRKVDEIKNLIAKGKLPLPMPTHEAEEVPYNRDEAQGDIAVVWCGRVRDRNVRDLFELNVAKTGVPLDPKEVRDPHLNEWIIMRGEDQSGRISLKLNRWTYPKFRDVVWSIDLDKDFVVVQGVKRGWETARRIQVKNIWVWEV
jgi:DNA polymerase III subunit alpha